MTRNSKIVRRFDITRKVDINQKVELEVLYGKYEGGYSSQVVDILDQDTFIINAPFSEGKKVNVPLGTKANIYLRQRDGLYSLPIKIIKRKKESTPLLVVSIVGSINKIQEREFFRLEIHQEFKYRIVGKELSTSLEKEYHTGILKDISAGGAKIITEDSLSEDQIIEIEVGFANLSFTTLLAKVVRITKIEKNEEEKYSIGVSFVNCSKEERDELVGWLFDKQRELRKKGLI